MTTDPNKCVHNDPIRPAVLSAMKHRDWTPTDLLRAADLPVTSNRVRCWLRGEGEITTATLARVMDACGVAVK